MSASSSSTPATSSNLHGDRFVDAWRVLCVDKRANENEVSK